MVNAISAQNKENIDILVRKEDNFSMIRGLEWVFQGYLPSVLKRASEKGAILYQFRESVEERWLRPFEFKFLSATLGPLALSTNGIISYYQENGDFTSLNISVGCGMSFMKEDKSPLGGLYWTLYPVYEFSVITAASAGQQFTQWRAATDMGFGFNFLGEMDIYLSFYVRLICFWIDGLEPFGAVPDFGMTIGWHFQEHQYIDRYRY
jgi:hypothetical protein